jgi:hypothetical protein
MRASRPNRVGTDAAGTPTGPDVSVKSSSSTYGTIGRIRTVVVQASFPVIRRSYQPVADLDERLRPVFAILSLPP